MRFRLLPSSSPLGWTPYAWLVYLSFFIAYAVVQNQPGDWLIDAAVLVAFLALYFRGFWVEGRALLAVTFAIVALGAITAPRNPGASCFFIFGAAFLGDVGRPAVAVRWLLVILGLVVVETVAFDLTPAFSIPAFVISILVGGSNIHFCEMRRKDRALIKAHEAAQHLATIVERERIARDLHDLLGHTLSTIVLKAELASKVGDRDPGRALREIRDVERISRTALAEVRQAVYSYRGERLESEMATARTALDAAGVTLVADVPALTLTTEQERTLALALREAVTNVIRHARARTCRVTLIREPQQLRLHVEDDGVGGGGSEGAGLSGMRARVAALGGTLDRDHRRGTRLTLMLPAAATPRDAVIAS
jgi:two-component system, NarL family, sensor histidine kinase DesK